jgi:predicted alpha-1,6-mannanase (GH76 family)
MVLDVGVPYVYGSRHGDAGQRTSLRKLLPPQGPRVVLDEGGRTVKYLAREKVESRPIGVRRLGLIGLGLAPLILLVGCGSGSARVAAGKGGAGASSGGGGVAGGGGFAGGDTAGGRIGSDVGGGGGQVGGSAGGQSLGGSGGHPSSGSGGAANPGTGGSGGSQGAGAGGAGGTAGSQAPDVPPGVDGCDLQTAHDHAGAALGATLINFWLGASQYIKAAPGNTKLTGYWTYAQTWDAVLDGVQRTRGQRFAGLIAAFNEGQAARGWLDNSYDHEVWMTLALTRAFDLTGDHSYLDTAETIYKDIMAEQDATCCAPHLGGIWRDSAKTLKDTAANAGAALAGARLATRTSKPEYLDFAKLVYAFWLSDMVDQPAFVVYDQLPANGQRVTGSPTLDQGVMIGAALELNAATGEAHYLTEAQGLGEYLISKATRTSSAGPVLDDGTPCTGDCAAWKGIGYRYLAALYRRDPTHKEYALVLQGGANALWALARDPATTFFSSNWAGPAPASGAIEAQSSATMALNLYAMLCGEDPTQEPALVYQAEEGWLHHVDFEATAGRDYHGYGYVSTFTKDDQGFTLDVDVPQAGKYLLQWRYTAGEGTGARSVRVNGQLVNAPLTFPATATWNSWTTIGSTADLPAGKSAIELSFESANGSKTSLDIDELALEAM